MDQIAGQHNLLAAVTNAIASGATVLTANQRAARTLGLSLARQQRAHLQANRQPAPIHTWDDWLHTLWNRIILTGKDTRLLLTPTQQHRLWCSILEADKTSEKSNTSEDIAAWTSLQTTNALAPLAAEAWDRLAEYNGLSYLRSLDATTDSRAFQNWAYRFGHLCQSENYLPPSGLAAAVASLLNPQLPDPSQQQILATHSIYLVGFDSITPAQQSLLETLASCGLSIERQASATFSTAQTSRHYHAVEDRTAEITAAAHWLRERLHHATQPQRIAIIVPSLDAARTEIDRIFRQTLAPELIPISPTATSQRLPYEFSLGRPLAESPMIVAALDLLRWPTTPLPQQAVTRLLLSPSFSKPSDYDARAELDAFVLRETKALRPELTLASVLTALKQGNTEETPRRKSLTTQLQNLRHTAQSLQIAPPRRGQHLSQREPVRPFADWADSIRELLKAADWAPRASLDSTEFQLLDRWERSLQDLARLDFDGTRITYREALTALESILSQSIFAPRSQSAPIQIMGPLEAAGSEFDALWFLHANESAWPVRPAPAPLLGWQLQHQLHMPGTDAALDRAYTRYVTQRIATSAQHVVFSYATQSSEGPERPSPLLAELNLRPLKLGAPNGQATTHADTPQVSLEVIADSARIPFTGPHVRGGTTVLQSQAACPFRAFAERRLCASNLEDHDLGLDGAQRGTLVHKALENLWHELKDQATLKSLTTDQRKAAIDRAITTAIERTRIPLSETPWENAYLSLQRERLHHILFPWLDLEAARTLDFSVRLQEEALRGEIGPLHLDLRFDRIDHTEFGDVLIDYKTGKASPKDWFGDRPNQPQIPLYAVLAHPEHLAAIAFGLVRPGKEMSLLGIETTQGIVSKPASFPAGINSLDQLVDHWYEILTRLAGDFAAGDARVDPKEPATCDHCIQDLLCRIDFSSFDPAALIQIDLEAESTE